MTSREGLPALPGGDLVPPPETPLLPIPGEVPVPPGPGAELVPPIPGPGDLLPGPPSSAPPPDAGPAGPPSTTEPEPISEAAAAAESTGSASGPGAGHDSCGAVRMTEFSLAGKGTPSGVAPGDDGAMWFTDPATSTVGRIDRAGKVTRYQVPGGARSIARGPTGALWVTLPDASAVARITPAGGVTTFPLPTRTGDAFHTFPTPLPADITAGPDGAMWFTEMGADQIGRITADGTITEYPVPHRHKAHIHPSSIAAGPDGGVWFSMNLIGTFGRIDPPTGTITEFPQSGGGGMVPANSMTAGPDGRLWFENPAKPSLGRMTTKGVVDDVPTTRRRPWAVSSGADGAVWFLDMWEDRPVRMTPDGVEAIFPPLAGQAVIGHGSPRQMAPAEDGAMWFAAPDANRLVRIRCQ